MKSSTLRSALSASPQALHVLDGVGDPRRRLLVLSSGGAAVHVAEGPLFGVVQIREAPVDQRPHEVQGRRRVEVGLDQPLGVGPPRLGGRLETVDVLPAEGRQLHPAHRLGRGRARLAVLPGDATDANHGLPGPVGEHEAHLQEDLQLADDGVAVAVGEALRAVPAVEHEALPRGRLRELRPQRVHLAAEDQRRQPPDPSARRVEGGGVGVLGLLGCDPRPPAPGAPGHYFWRKSLSRSPKVPKLWDSSFCCFL